MKLGKSHRRVSGIKKQKKPKFEFPPNFFDFLDPPSFDGMGFPSTGYGRDLLQDADVFKPKFKKEKGAIRGMWAVSGITKMGIPFIMLTPLRGDTVRIWNNALISNQCDPTTAVRVMVVPDPEEK